MENDALNEIVFPQTPEKAFHTQEGQASIEVKNLRKTFGRKVAVQDVSFQMNSGEIVGLLGPNGAGKTTVFYMIAGFIPVTGGKIFLGDQEITTRPMYQRAQLGISYLPQEPSVFRKLTVEDNLKAILETRAGMTKGAQHDFLEFLLSELGLHRVRHQKAFTLSGGERRRTEIARCLAIEPRFLLLDEPFAGIDPIAVSEIKGIMRDLAAKGIGVLITDHNVRDTLEITHRAFIIHQGNLLASGTKDEILADPLARQLYLGEEFRL